MSGSTAAAARPSSAAHAERRRRLASLLPVAGLAAVTGLAYRRIFGLHEVLVGGLVSAVVPVVLVLLWSGTRAPQARPRPLVGSFAICAIAWWIAATALYYRDDAFARVFPTPSLLRRIGADVLDAPRGILTTVAPVPGHSDLLVLVSVTAWIAGYAGAELALRGGSTALPALPGLVLLAVPVALSTGAPGDNTWLLAAAVGTAALLLMCRAPGRRSPLRLLTAGLPWVAVLTVLAGFVAPRLPGAGDPPDLHDKVSPPPPVRLSAVNPLDRISEWLLSPDETLFTVHGPAEPDRYWRLAVLDKYDGTTWYPVTGLLPTGGRIPDTGPKEAAGSRVTQEVTLGDLDGMWLPAADRPTQVRATNDLELAVDPGSGAVAAGSRLRPGLRYQVVSSIPKYDPDRLQWLAAASDPAYTTLPDRDAGGEPIPAVEEFGKLAAKATQGSTFPYQQALRLAEWLRSNHHYDVTAVPGHSYRSLQFFLDSSKEGTSEQFASAFAVLGRTLGLPTRVVVGFSRGTGLPDGTWRVDSGDVVAWPEVEFAGVGWVPFYPTPGEAGRSGAPKNNPDDPSTGGQKPPPVAPAPAAANPQTRAEKDAKIAMEERPTASGPMSDEDGDAGTPLWWWALPIAAVAAMMAGQLGLAAAAPGLVRRRRARGPTDDRVFGAWREIRDALDRVGMPGGRSLTVREVAAYGEDTLPPDVGAQMRPLAELVNGLAYGGRSAAAEDADQAWRTSTAVAEALRRSDARPSRRARWAARMSPRQTARTLRKDSLT